MLTELAIRNLSRIKVRSVLAVIGITIGVMAIGSIGIFGQSVKVLLLQNFKDLMNEVIITPDYTHGFRSISKRTLRKIENLPYVEMVIPVKSQFARVTYREKSSYVTVYGLNMRDVRSLLKLKEGNYRDCLVGAILASSFKLRVGSRIVIRGRPFRVGGIIVKSARFDINPNYAVIIPLREFDRIFNEKGYKMVIVRVRNVNEVDKFVNLVNRVINRRKSQVIVLEFKIIIERWRVILSKWKIFLMAIAGVSLLVAGVSILNIMLMSTLERTKEIGVMRAIGAYRETIIKMFLLEALILGVVGSVAGGVLSVLGGYALDMIMLKTAKYVFMPSTIIYVVIGVVFGIITALVSSLYPAWKASRLEPIEALRYE